MDVARESSPRAAGSLVPGRAAGRPITARDGAEGPMSSEVVTTGNALQARRRRTIG